MKIEINKVDLIRTLEIELEAILDLQMLEELFKNN